ncbi:unnamed protein product [Musa hybrid cultivar]
MADPSSGAVSPEPVTEAGATADVGCTSRKEKRKALKKLKRKQTRREAAIREREEDEARSNDPEEQRKIRLREQEEVEIAERERKLFEERERLWFEAAAARKAAEEEEEQRRKELMEKSQGKNQHDAHVNEEDGDDEWDYIEEGPAEIIWQGNEIIVKKKRVRVAKKNANKQQSEEDDNRPTSNPLPPQSVAFASYMNGPSISAQEVLERVAQEVPNFGTEQDKAHCPFHLKTGACRFGPRCSRVHFHPDKSCTLLIKNMYNGPGLVSEQDEGLEVCKMILSRDNISCNYNYTDEEVERCYEEFYEDVHTEFLKFGELVNFKVCKNGSYHLRGNVYVHYKSLDSAVLAYNNINGRFFAGKQITCEFVGVTKWKVAICGEYMKSKLKTCSHGSACNFIHCFRNPGGDYEWADWDNPPPKYWIRKMIALFGPSNEYEHQKQVDLKEFDRPRCSDRKRTPIDKRYVLLFLFWLQREYSLEVLCRYFSRRSDSELDELDNDSPAKNRREQSSRSKEKPTSVEKHERSEEYDKLSYYDDREYKRKHREDSSGQKRVKPYVNEHMKSKRYKSRFQEQQKYAQFSDYTDDDRELSDDHSNSLSSDKSSHRLSIDEERYNGRSCSDDLGSDVDPSRRITSQHSGCLTESREYGRRSKHKSYDYEIDGHSGKFGKPNDHHLRVSSHDLDWKARSEGSDLEDADARLPHSRSRREKKHDRSSRKRNLHQEKGDDNDRSDEPSNKKLKRKEEKRYSGSSLGIRSVGISRPRWVVDRSAAGSWGERGGKGSVSVGILDSWFLWVFSERLSRNWDYFSEFSGFQDRVNLEGQYES